jgi:RHS repeat-associated protein
MSKELRTIAVYLSLTIGALAVANGADLKFRAALGAEPVVARYLVTLDASVAAERAGASAEALARAYLGQLEPFASSDVRQFAITMLPGRARILSADPRVREVVEIAAPDQATAVPPAPSSAAGSLTRQHFVPVAQDSTSSGTYLYDGSGNIKSIGTDTFIYDSLGRLKEGTVQGNQQSYTYDAFGNRLTATRASGAVGCAGGTACEAAVTVLGQSNHLSGVTYDEAGNVTSGFGAAYTYDGTGMVTGATVGSDQRDFAYTADDERIAVKQGLSWTWSVRDQGGKVLREFTSLETSSSPLALSSHTWSKDYIWRDGLLLASVSQSASGPTTYHYHLDHLGTPRLITREGGVLVGKHTYYPFGAEMALTPSESATELMKFTGHERDVVAGDNHSVDYMHARYYSPTAGRFLSIDPVGGDAEHPQSWNRYAYVRNNPIGNTDPDGKICIPCAAVGALAAVSYESYRQVTSGEPVNNKRLFAAVGIGAVAGATLGAAAEAAPVLYNAAYANPGAVATATSIAGAVLGPPGPSSAPEVAFEKATTQLAGELQYTKTAAQSLAKAGRDIPGQTIAGAILSGTRSADPQGAKGAIQITQDVYKFALRGGAWVQVKYELRIIYNDAEKLVMHANIQ